ncbi:MAG: molybdopterin-dependent oxidoreductase, partial [Gammaproteobacteria bacterium]|nr:molybdopterin-dependent oxidoreductase [Gammaproteobacteria bacterium]
EHGVGPLDVVLVLGEDVSNTAARVALALRQAARGTSFEMAASAGIPEWQDAGIRGHGQHHRSPVFIASVLPTRIDDIARETLRATPSDIARSGFAIAHRIDSAFADAGTKHDAFVQEAGTALLNAERPLIVTGAGCADASVLEAAANIAWALKARGSDPALLIASGEANTMGVAAMSASLSMDAALDAAASGEADTLVVLENDLYRRADAARVTAALEAAQVIVLDALETPTAEAASIALPAASYAESTGTFVNYEGRAQRFYRVFEPTDEIAPSWQWIARLAAAAGRNDCTWDGIDAVTRACAAAVSALSGIGAVAPAADYRVEAQTKIPRQPHRYSGRTAMRADVNIHEPKTTVDTETPFSYSMEGENTGGQPGSVVPYVWTPGWNSNQSVFKFQQEVGGPLRGGDPGVRLFDGGTANEGLAARFREAPEPPRANGGYRLVPSHALFGSEELSARSWPILERRRAPYLVLHPEDAERIGVEAGAGITGPSLGASFAVRTDEHMARGTAAVAVGYAEAPGPLSDDAAQLLPDPDFVPVDGDPNVIARG